jgi:D-alanyl-D-alanine carboxypeptidase
MKVLLALALVVCALLAPAASANPARELTKTGLPGAVVLDDHRVYAAGNVRAGDRFRAGSTMKTFVATITLQLVAERRLKLDDPVPEAGGLPLRTLLNHTSGVFNHSEDPRVAQAGLLKRWRPRELVAISRSHDPYFPPGTGHHYSNTNYVMLGLMIERITGHSLQRELERRILRPLKLRDTSYDEGPRVRGVAPAVSGGEDVTVQNTSWAGAAGALVSTARDLGRFYSALLGGKLLAPEQLAAMKTIDPVTEFYGLGLFTGRTTCGPMWGHNGQVPGYYTLAFAAEDGSRPVVILVNERPVSKAQEDAMFRVLDEVHCS